MGPFELLDLVGGDVTHAVMVSIFEQFFDEPMYQPSAQMAVRVAGGLLGRKSKQGFYNYDGAPAKGTPTVPVPPGAKPVAAWVASEAETALDAALADQQAVAAQGREELLGELDRHAAGPLGRRLTCCRQPRAPMQRFCAPTASALALMAWVCSSAAQVCPSMQLRLPAFIIWPSRA